MTLLGFALVLGALARRWGGKGRRRQAGGLLGLTGAVAGLPVGLR